tara:strand:- start:334 stop:588 length:255 start_codon:yes stop_codon:yes gene_type:complete
MKFNYIYKETSTDIRSFKISSEVMLIEDEVRLLASEATLTTEDTEFCDFNEWEQGNGLPSKGAYQVTFLGTEYGDNTQTEFYEV